MMKFIDDVVLSGTRRTDDGYLIASVKCARAGIQQYLGDEMGKPDLGVVSVYRPESEVFSKDSLKTFAARPVTDNHPGEEVNAKNWKDYAVGSVGEDVLRDGEFIRVPIVLMDESVIDKVESGKREISMGYTCDIEWEDGVTPDGHAYQAKQTNLRMNHLAIVDRGRAGHECRVGDDAGFQWGASPTSTTKGEIDMSDKLRNVVVDGLSVETTEQGAQAIQKLQNDNADLNGMISDKDADHQKELDAKDAELAKKDAEIKALENKQLDDSAIDALVQDRADLIADAKLIDKDADFGGMSNDDIRKAAVMAFRGEDSVADKSDAYIDAAFDLAVEQVKEDAGKGVDPVRSAVQGRDHKKSEDNGQQSYEDRLSNAWKQEEGK